MSIAPAPTLADKPAGRGLKPVLVSIAAAAFLVGTGNHSFWSDVFSTAQSTPLQSPGFAAALALAMGALFTLVISLFSFPRLFKPALAMLFMIAAACGYFMDTYGVVVDSGMLENVLETDPAESAGLLSLALFWRLAWAGVLPSLVIFSLPLNFAPWPRQMFRRLATMLLALLVLGVAVYSHYKDFSLVGRANHGLRYLINPTYPVYAAGQLLAAKFHTQDAGLRPLGMDANRVLPARTQAKPRLVVLVLGETARAANFSLDGYARDTNPELARRDIINFKPMASCGTATAVSLPCMFSRQSRREYDDYASAHSENLLDVLRHAGIQVLWRENNSGCKGVCERVATQDMTRLQVEQFCAEQACFDEILLYRLQDWLDSHRGDAFLVLHQQGSHGPEYYKRYPAAYARFKPECRSNRPQECSRQEIVNAYDNSIAYTDHFLAQVIDFLKSRQDRYATAMVYVSDHGESLGENGLYLHGFPYLIAPEEQTRVPFLLWFSEAFRQTAELDSACLRGQRSHDYSHDNLFDSVLGLMQVNTRIYQPNNDILAPCRDTGWRTAQTTNKLPHGVH